MKYIIKRVSIDSIIKIFLKSCESKRISPTINLCELMYTFSFILKCQFSYIILITYFYYKFTSFALQRKNRI